MMGTLCEIAASLCLLRLIWGKIWLQELKIAMVISLSLSFSVF
jgi:hypothetical protein